MKTRLFFTTLAIAAASVTANAQLNQGGVPLSIQSNIKTISPQTISLKTPNWEAHLEKERSLTPEQAFTQPYIVALFTEANVGFPHSGTFTSSSDGSLIWKAQIKVANAPAIGLYYNNFNLPKGVKLYLSNERQNQILGAYTAENNDPSGEFVTEAVQGNIVNIELNISQDVNINDIKFNIDKAAVYYRAIENLLPFIDNVQTIDQYDASLLGISSKCGINSICPQSAGYELQRRSAGQILIPVGSQGVGACSGSLVNNTANTTADCKPYFLIASHCEGGNFKTNATFNQVMIRYNFEKSTCDQSGTTNGNTIIGADFVARSDYDSAAPDTDIKGDFLLLKLRQSVPTAWNAVLIGWDNRANITTTVASPKKFIGFHHPAGDSKKLSFTQNISSEAVGASNSHWLALNQEGYAAPGSSGSSLFDGDGRVIGIASIAGEYQVNPACKISYNGDPNVFAMNAIYYSKLSYVWNYSVDGGAPNSKLQPWLDPSNSATTLNAVNSDCTPITNTSITNINTELDDAIAIYPNPSTSGNVTLQINLNEKVNLSIQVIDVTGKAIKNFRLENVTAKNAALDLSDVSNGVYMVKFVTDNGTQTTKRVVIAK